MTTNIPNRSISSSRNPVLPEGEKRAFIPFSPETHNAVGRNVFIDAALLAKFVSLVDPASVDGKFIIKQIIQLKALAGGLKSSANTNNKFMHMDKIKHVQIFYQMMATTAEKTVSVYITDIRPAFKDDGTTFGIYNVASNGRRSNQSQDLVNQDFAVMTSGTDPDIVKATEQALEMVGDDGWGGTPAFSLVYMPSFLYNDLGAWVTPEMKTYSPEAAAEKLAGYLEKTQKHRQAKGGEPVKWIVAGESSKLLRLAMSKVRGFLDFNRFKFINPTTDVSPLLALLDRKGAKLDEEPVTINRSNRASMVAMSLVGNNIAHTLKGMGKSYQGEASKLSKESAVGKQAFGHTLSAVKAKQTKTFMEAVNRVKGGAGW